MTESVIARGAAADAVLVVADNLYMYGPPSGPMTEDSPRWASGPKGQLRAGLEQMFLAAHRKWPGRCCHRPRLGLLWTPCQLSRQPCW